MTEQARRTAKIGEPKRTRATPTWAHTSCLGWRLVFQAFLTRAGSKAIQLGAMFTHSNQRGSLEAEGLSNAIHTRDDRDLDGLVRRVIALALEERTTTKPCNVEEALNVRCAQSGHRLFDLAGCEQDLGVQLLQEGVPSSRLADVVLRKLRDHGALIRTKPLVGRARDLDERLHAEPRVIGDLRILEPLRDAPTLLDVEVPEREPSVEHEKGNELGRLERRWTERALARLEISA